MKAKTALFLMGSSILLATIPGCSRKSEPPAKPAPAVVAVDLARRTVRSELTLTGTIEPDRSARLAAQVDGEVVTLEVREGTSVSTGQVLVRIDPSRLAAALEEARADEMAARAQATDSRRILERDKALFERQGISKESLEKSETDVLRHEAAEAKARARVAGLNAQLTDTEIKAPFDGYVLERSVELGDTVKNGTPLLVIASKTLHALIPVSEVTLAGLNEGATVDLRSDADTGRGCTAIVSRIRPKIDPATRTGEVEAVPNKPSCPVRWLPGMMVRATFVLAERQDTLAIPAESAVFLPDGTRSVFIVEGNTARRRNVNTGIEGGGWIEITDGLTEGEKIIIRGFEKLKDGTAVALPGTKPKPDKSGQAPAGTKEKL